jgi:hypothetical protein
VFFPLMFLTSSLTIDTKKTMCFIVEMHAIGALNSRVTYHIVTYLNGRCSLLPNIFFSGSCCLTCTETIPSTVLCWKFIRTLSIWNLIQNSWKIIQRDNLVCDQSYIWKLIYISKLLLPKYTIITIYYYYTPL